MSVTEFDPTSVASEANDIRWLKRNIFTLFSEEEIKRSLRIACAQYENLDRVFYDRVRKSDEYRRLLFWTVWDVIVFLRSFRDKGACGYAHETWKRINDVLLTPENCLHKDWYAWCGHPELNGMLIAEVLSDMLLDKVHPVRLQVARIGRPIFEVATLWDTLAAATYQRMKNPSSRVIPIIPEIRTLQELHSSHVYDEFQRIAREIEQAYAE